MEGPRDTTADNPSGITERFEIEKVLSAGRSTLTYKALDTVLHEEVTVKTMAPDTVRSEKLQQFHSDLKQVSKLDHDSIAKVLDYGQTRSGKPYVVLEYLDGTCLKDELKNGSPLPFQSAVSIMKNLTEAVYLAHDQGVVHCDIKPSNIFLVNMEDGEEVPVLVDFGFGQIRKENEKGIVRSPAGDFAGDPLYMSPEQIAGNDTDKYTDYYSLGCVFYELLSGRPPYKGPSSDETFNMHLTEPVPPLIKVADNEETRSSIDLIINSLLQKTKNERSLPLSEIHEMLSSIEAKEFVDIPKPGTTKSSTVVQKKPGSVNFLSILGTTIVLTFVLIGLTTYLSHSHSQKRQVLDKPINGSGQSGSQLIDHYLEDDGDKHLKLKFINISDQDAEKLLSLQNLETIEIGGAKITVNGLEPLLTLENLVEVKVFNPKNISASEIEELNSRANKPIFRLVNQ